MLRLLACLALVIAACAAHGQAKPTRILFVGNSLTSVTDVPGRLVALARAMGREAQVESVTFNGYTLADHWSDGRALAAIRKGGWDYVVLQSGSSGRRDSGAELVESVRQFAAPIRAVGARPAIYMVWPLSDRQYEFPNTIEAYRSAAEAVDGLLLPVGEAWLRALSKDKRLRLYGDAIHPTSVGSDLIVLTMFFAFFPAGPQEFDEKFVERLARQLDIPARLRDPLVDAATLAIDQPLKISK